MVTQKDLEICREYRKKLKLVAENDIGNLHCDQRVNNAIKCWAECPVPCRSADNLAVVTKQSNLDVKPSKKADKEDESEKKHFPSREVESFINLQCRVFEKLAWHPHLWKLLDKLSSAEIEERLLGKSGLEAMPKHVGGEMKLKASEGTKKMFEDLEKQYAVEDEKKGKKPYAFLNEPTHVESIGDGDNFDLRWTDEIPAYGAYGHFENGVWVEPKQAEQKPSDVECPVCHHTQKDNLPKCEICGAKMKGEKKKNV